MIGWIVVIFLYLFGAGLMAGIIYLDHNNFTQLNSLSLMEENNLYKFLAIIFWFIVGYVFLLYIAEEIMKRWYFMATIKMRIRKHNQRVQKHNQAIS